MMGGLNKPDFVRRLLTRRVARGANAQAFTIVETLIVLAVTGMLFVSAAILISGRQSQTAFSQSIQQIQAQIRQTINDVAVGYLPNKGNFSCVASGGAPQLSNGGGTGQGTNSGCIFLGKAMQFRVAGANVPEPHATFVIAGLQAGGPGGTESASLAEAAPRAVAPTPTQSGLPNLTESDTLENGLTTYAMWYNNGSVNQPIGAVAFTGGLAQYSPTGALVSSSQQVQIVPVGGTALGMSQAQVAEAVNTRLGNSAQSPPDPVNGVSICFVSGGTNQSGLITIGGRNNPLAVNLSIRSNRTCA